MPFPVHRPRRLRRTESIRRLVRETSLAPDDFVLPLFAVEGEGIRKPINSMPGNFQLSVDELVKECAECVSLGIGGVILFGIPKHKDEQASGAYDDNGIVQQAVRALKAAYPKLTVITDVCNCEYTCHGHCGLVVDNDVANDPTLEWLAAGAVSHARAGADIVAPSDMMDGRVAAIRTALDQPASPTSPSSATPPSTPAASTDPSATPPKARPSSATAAPIRWTPPTPAKPCAKSNSTSPKAPT